MGEPHDFWKCFEGLEKRCNGPVTLDFLIAGLTMFRGGPFQEPAASVAASAAGDEGGSHPPRLLHAPSYAGFAGEEEQIQVSPEMSTLERPEQLCPSELPASQNDTVADAGMGSEATPAD